MQIWVDADACPVVVKDILFRAAKRWQRPLTLVANQMLHTPPSPLIKAVQVPRGFDVADDYIVLHASPGDLVITGDIPLAAQLVEKSAFVLSPRGERFTADNIRERLSIRDMLEELRGAGVETGGPAAFSQADRREFANALDRLMMMSLRKSL
ncbi:YaiI/YqxD family protein [Paenalcaligenes niemegkensis]|uniref:YaiI/YqxD family protein n=1 Tax=Paenalcaligenes niemegkensis TaxID=2895469 RepID=UPI001EE8AD1C|nr:YaiI/YqxD family protein [Paenalcaligenes niemegkensis]MCQ9618009.1 YaiI/YqxD family protein [Paenalcaligenes niemegkensis]